LQVADVVGAAFGAGDDVIDFDAAFGAGGTAQRTSASGGGEYLVADVWPYRVCFEQPVVPDGQAAVLQELGKLAYAGKLNRGALLVREFCRIKRDQVAVTDEDVVPAQDWQGIFLIRSS
jgi:hypothetical protein